MVLELGTEEQLFTHSADFDQGGGKERIGQATVVVSLDGTGDTDNIQEGIDMLPSGGGVIYIKEGTYKIDTTILLTSNVSLLGSGNGTILETSSAISMITLTNITNSSIDNIRFDGKDTAGATAITFQTSTASSHIRNCYFKDCQNGIYFNGALQCWATNNTFTSGSDTAIEIQSGERNIIQGNKISFYGTYGIMINSGGWNIITGNAINNNSGAGIYISSSSYFIIQSNEIYYTAGGDAIGLLTCGSGLIDGNYIHTSGGTHSGIHLNASDYIIISNNHCRACTDYGIDISNNTCDKNIVTGNICLWSTTGQINDAGTNTHPNGASGTNNLALDDLNIIA